ncbi:SGNH hydrolase [Lizonia empirigonia]|nr:SGNH hydrolase [Lizonia empirigonia]
MSAMATKASEHWVAGWYAPPNQMLPAGLTGRKLRQVIHLHAGGQAIRLHLSNRYGAKPITLANVSVARSIQGPVIGKDSAQVMFGGQTEVVLEPGTERTSDPVSMHVEAFTTLAVSFHLVDWDPLTGHLFASRTSYVSADTTKQYPAELAFLEYPLMTNSWWLITGIDVMSSVPLNAVVAFGSSTTDGAGGTKYMAVINAGLSGNQLTTSENESLGLVPELNMPKFMFGDTGLRRYDWDLTSKSGATDLIVNIGSNDLRAGIQAASIIEAYKQIAKRARKDFQKVFGTLILPGGYTPEQSEQRQIVNDWMTEHGLRYFDAIFDMASPLRAEADHTKLDPAYDSGDGIHPNNEGYRLMADAIDITKLSESLSE